MKIINLVLLLLAVVVTGCETMQGNAVSTTLGRANYRYTEQDLALALTQDDQSAGLILTLKNISAQPLTNYFPQTVFEGKIWVLQEGAVPIEMYPSNYFDLKIRAEWVNPETVIPPDGTLTYRIPLSSLLHPFTRRKPDGTRPVFVYAFMDGFAAVSNLLPLNHAELIPGGGP